MDPSFLKIFFLFLGFFRFSVSSSEVPQEMDINESDLQSKHRRIDSGTKFCGVCTSEAITATLNFCSCGQLVHRCCLVDWFRDNNKFIEYPCSLCGKNFQLSDFLTFENLGHFDDEISFRHFALKAFVALKMPVKSIKVSEDRLTGTIIAERNGYPFTFTTDSKEMLGINGNRFIEYSLIAAIRYKNYELINFIADNHINFRNVNRISDKAFGYAIKHNVIKSVQLLLDLGICSSFGLNKLETFLFQAFDENKSEIFELILKKKDDPVFSFQIEVNFLLKIAIEQQKQEIISIVIQRCIIPDDFTGPIILTEDIISDMVLKIMAEDNVQGMKNVLSLNIPFSSIKFKSCVSILVIAATKSREMFQLFLTSGLSFTEDKVSEKIHCYYGAIDNDRLDNLNLMPDFDINITRNDGFTVLHFAIYWSNAKVVEGALKLGAKVNYRTIKFGYPLHRAIAKDNYTIVLMLLKAGASLKVTDISRKDLNALSMSLMNGKLESFKAIAFYKGTNLFWNQNGLNSLQIAIFNRQIHVVQYLINLGISAVQHDGKTNWMLSNLASKDSSEMLEFLFANCGVNVYEEVMLNDSPDQTPLMIAITSSQIKNIEVFLKYGYNPNKRINDKNGSSTLLHYAVKSKNLDIAKLLIRYGADTNALDQEGKTAFSHVQTSEMTDTLKNMDEFL